MTSAYSSPPRIIVGYSSPSPSSSSAQKPTVATTTTQQTIYRVPTSNFSYNMASTPPAYMDNCNSSNADTSATNKPTDVKNHHIFVHDNSHNYNLDRQRNEGLLHSESAEVRVVMYPSMQNGASKSLSNGQTSSSPNGGELKLLDASGTSSTSSYSAENCQPQYSVLSSIPPQFSSQQQNGVEYVVVHDNMQQQKHEMQRVLHPEPMNSTGRMLMHAVDAELEEDLLEDLAYEYSDHSKSGGNGTRRVKDAQRKRRRRADESSAEAEARRAKNLAAKRRRLEKETEDEKQKRRARDAETKRVRRQRETPEQRSRRLTRDSERMRRTRRIKKLLGPTIAALDSEEHKKNNINLNQFDMDQPKRQRIRYSKPQSMNHGATTPNGVPVSPNQSSHNANSFIPISSSCLQIDSHQSPAPIIITSRQPPPPPPTTTSYIQTTSNGHLVHHLPHPPLISHIHHQQPTYERLNNNNINNNNIVINQQPQRLPINLVDGQQPSPQILTLHVTIPNSSTQQQHILHLPQSALPQHIIVQRQPPSHVEPILNQLHHSNFAVHQNHSYRPNGKLQGGEVYQEGILESPQRPQNGPASCSSTGSIKSGNSNSRCTSSSNVSPPLTEEQAQRRRRNAERSRRRRAMETPQQRAERNRRTAERMRNRRARLASERRQNRPEGVDTTTVVARQVVPLSVDRFEEIFQSVISRCTKTEVKSEMDPPVMECAPPRMSHNPFSACAGLRIVESQSSPATSQLEPHQAEPNTDRTTIIYCQQQNLGYHTTMNGGKKHVPNNRSVSPQNFEDL